MQKKIAKNLNEEEFLVFDFFEFLKSSLRKKHQNRNKKRKKF